MAANRSQIPQITFYHTKIAECASFQTNFFFQSVIATLLYLIWAFTIQNIRSWGVSFFSAWRISSRLRKAWKKKWKKAYGHATQSTHIGHKDGVGDWSLDAQLCQDLRGDATPSHAQCPHAPSHPHAQPCATKAHAPAGPHAPHASSHVPHSPTPPSPTIPTPAARHVAHVLEHPSVFLTFLWKRREIYRLCNTDIVFKNKTKQKNWIYQGKRVARALTAPQNQLGVGVTAEGRRGISPSTTA